MSAYNLSLACNHCEEPLCRDACPSGAISKREDGIVFIDKDKCLGCRYCEWACPYNALRFDARTNTVSKCHFCFEDLDRGEPPACVPACPMRALDFGDLAELRKKYGDTQQVFPLPEPSQVEPA